MADCLDQWLAASRERRVGRNGLVWLIEWIRPHSNPAFGLNVRGRIIDQGVELDTFWWLVPNIDDPAYVLTGEAVTDLVNDLGVQEP